MDCCEDTFDILQTVQQQTDNIHCQTESFQEFKLYQQNSLSNDMDKQRDYQDEDYYQDNNSIYGSSNKKTCSQDHNFNGEYQQNFFLLDQTPTQNSDSNYPNKIIISNQIFDCTQDNIFNSVMSGLPISQDSHKNPDQFLCKFQEIQEEEKNLQYNDDKINQEGINYYEIQCMCIGSLNEDNLIQNNNQIINQQIKITPQIINNQTENTTQKNQNQQLFSDQNIQLQQINNQYPQQQYSSLEHCPQNLYENINNSQISEEITNINTNFHINSQNCQVLNGKNMTSRIFNNFDDYLSYQNIQKQLEITNYHEQSIKENQLKTYKQDDEFPESQFIQTNGINSKLKLTQYTSHQPNKTISNKTKIEQILVQNYQLTQNVFDLENVQKVVTYLCKILRPYFPDFDRLNQKQSDPNISKVIGFIRKVVVDYYKRLGEPIQQQDKPNRQTHCMCSLDKQYKNLSGLCNHIKNHHEKTPIWCWSVKINEKVGRRPEAIPEISPNNQKQSQKKSFASKAKRFCISNFNQYVSYTRHSQN
ncbi:hypothetical protein TTHERM_00024290 (macronuclear) [Tetrahymena thermophila SB210]|uniref:Zinc finger, C2H2 type family protein n=1 Tax=Tetrahymena thermophila (strain SB210) TaxID=312017 RepID=Q22R52_TETTS|nr:hypothetical protein TTHERM_00024290 [Tetrahymena thermophila SB210]EAR88270.2 hypothetical protein TTHERM_00024290 [Tetrahymena thermophila SB210]|eukprot:XP_001008515.2 hypothetical protein TTHERM_00024290 [Tetrahymena thermophila SB210]